MIYSVLISLCLLNYYRYILILYVCVISSFISHSFCLYLFINSSFVFISFIPIPLIDSSFLFHPYSYSFINSLFLIPILFHSLIRRSYTQYFPNSIHSILIPILRIILFMMYREYYKKLKT